MTRPRSLYRVLVPFGSRRDRCRQDAVYRLNAAIKGQLAERQITLNGIAGQRTHANENRKSDRQIEMTALLAEIGGRQVDRDALRRQAETEGAERASDPFA